MTSSLKHLHDFAKASLSRQDWQEGVFWWLIDDIICHARTIIVTQPETPISQHDWKIMQHRIQARVQGMPCAYITGFTDFWDIKLKVNQHCLIPRKDTEHLVSKTLELFDSSTSICVADLGTGSGAIALALARHRPQWYIIACDIQAKAIATAASNCLNHAASRVLCIQSNWADAIGTAQCDLIVANPPYIAPDDIHLTQGDCRFEPRYALQANNQGLEHYPILAKAANRCLKNKGYILVEMGYDQLDAVNMIFQEHGFVLIDHVTDYGGHQRVCVAQKI